MNLGFKIIFQLQKSYLYVSEAVTLALLFDDFYMINTIL